MAIFDSIMSPLGKENCMIYYFLGIFVFVYALITLLTGLVKVFDKKSRGMGVVLLLNSVSMFITYYLTRIMYSICIKAL
tara:strand:+ start:1021 stop:1257 length:237 start_codon:yes stop_codon:yes gene_type:complete